MQAQVKCQQCGTDMKKATRSEHNYGAQILGIGVFLIGFICLFVFPIGTVFGVILMIVAARMGYKKAKVWLCPSCGYFFERAK